MKKVNLFLVMVLIAVISTYVQATMVTQTFDTAPADWVQSGTTAISFSNTNNTGGNPAGEAGGVLPGNLTYRVYYADTTIGGSYDLKTTAMTASGEVKATGNGGDGLEQGFVGYINTGSTGFADAMGFAIVDSSSTRQRIRGFMNFNDGTAKMTSAMYLYHSDVYTFNFSWDPVAMKLSFTLFDVTTNLAVGTKTVLLDSTELAKLGSVNAFGIGNGADNTSWGPTEATQVTAYIDNVTYVPEPATLAVLGLGSMMMLRRNRK